MTGAIVQLCSSALAQDAASMAKSMQDAYRNLTSYTQKTSASGRIAVGAQSQVNGMTAEIRYKKPNLSYILVSSPVTGTLVATNNSTGMTVYRSKENLVNKMPTADSLKLVVGSLSTFGIAASLDPLYMLEGNSLDPFVSSWSSKGVSTINGVKCTQIVGNLKTVALQKAKSGTVSYWIDSAYMVHKVVIDWRGNKLIAKTKPTAKDPTPKLKTLFYDRAVTETVQEFKANPALSDADFTYPIPKSAHVQPAAPVKK